MSRRNSTYKPYLYRGSSAPIPERTLRHIKFLERKKEFSEGPRWNESPASSTPLTLQPSAHNADDDSDQNNDENVASPVVPPSSSDEASETNDEMDTSDVDVQSNDDARGDHGAQSQRDIESESEEAWQRDGASSSPLQHVVATEDLESEPEQAWQRDGASSSPLQHVAATEDLESEPEQAWQRDDAPPSPLQHSLVSPTSFEEEGRQSPGSHLHDASNASFVSADSTDGRQSAGDGNFSNPLEEAEDVRDDISQSSTSSDNPSNHRDAGWDFMYNQSNVAEDSEDLYRSNNDTPEDIEPDFFNRVARTVIAENNGDDDPLHGIPISSLRTTLLILATKLRHNLTFTATEDIVKLAGVLAETDIPCSNKYFWKKTLHKFSKGVSVHHICSSCFEYVGVAKLVEDKHDDFEELQCSSCGQIIDPKANVKAGYVYMYFSLQCQIKNIIEVCGESCTYSEDRKKTNKYAFEDIFDGDMYKSNVDPGTITVNFSVDGVPVFKSSKFSLHPLVCTLNDVEPKKRADYLMLCGLFFGNGGPKKMSAYLTPFVAECRVLFEEGVTFVWNGEQQRRRVQVLMGVSDTVQRPVLRCSTQFNGKYGCGLCMHPGIEIDKGLGKARVYPLKDTRGHFIPAVARTHSETLEHSVTNEYGMKGRSILCDLPRFDIINGLDLDWPHAVLFGVARQFARLMFQSDQTYKERPFYLANKIRDVDKFLLSIKPSLEVSRTPRKMSDFKFWKMHEWAIWLLFYSLPTIRLFIENRDYLHHWALLVEGISLLSKKSIMRSEIDQAENCLLLFVENIPNLYGLDQVSFNVHLLTHLAQSVRNFACLWTHSSFIYEDCYQDLLSFVQSSQGVPIQICDSMRMRWVIKQLENICKDELSERESKYLKSILNRKVRAKPFLCLDGVSLLGAGSPSPLKDCEFFALQRISVDISRGSPVYHFDRALIGTEVVQTKNYTRVSKRNSYVVLLKDGNIFEIVSFLVVNENGVQKCFAVGQYFTKTNQSFLNNRLLSHLICLTKNKEDQMAAVIVNNILEKVTFLDLPAAINVNLACVHPNHIEFLA